MKKNSTAPGDQEHSKRISQEITTDREKKQDMGTRTANEDNENTTELWDIHAEERRTVVNGSREAVWLSTRQVVSELKAAGDRLADGMTGENISDVHSARVARLALQMARLNVRLNRLINLDREERDLAKTKTVLGVARSARVARGARKNGGA